MTLTRLAALAATLVLLATGCSGDQDPPLEASPTSAAPSATAAAEPAGHPLKFIVGSSRTLIACFPDGDRRLIVFDEVRTTRPLALTGIRIAGDAMRIERTWLAPLPKKALGDSGAIDLDAGGTSMSDIEAWEDRAPLSRATLEAGQRYVFFARVTVRADRRFGDLDLQWDDGDTAGSSAYPFAGRTRSGGC